MPDDDGTTTNSDPTPSGPASPDPKKGTDC